MGNDNKIILTTVLERARPRRYEKFIKTIEKKK